MAAWSQLVDELNALSPDPNIKNQWLISNLTAALQNISKLRKDRNVLFYASAFLQKPHLNPDAIQITYEEINGFMSCLYGMDFRKGLTLILHTPGGVTNAAESIVQYLHSKFSDIEVIIPTFAMSAGTMISLSANRIIMGRPSQLGPIDPQIPISGKFVSARAIVDQFAKAKEEISSNLSLAHAWAPILQSLGPALLVEAEYALDYGERMVASWLENRMLRRSSNKSTKAKDIAHYFNDASNHKSHGRRIDMTEAKKQGVNVTALESNQLLQNEVLTAYHLATILIGQTLISKLLWNNQGISWVKNHS
ncbi:SDH family Clp fold serine proteinase [Polynucleobacter necessarius]|uniref:SDH family Clp fold serine proteinase n=1 Tax=Polynucleobacter necessarius TaxID=576610 RepID=UPI000E094107|nr:serine protease [Polynucleobacter necessarius]